MKTIFLTGLPCSGKTTIAESLRTSMEENSYYNTVIHLDGDIMRKGLCSDLGFSPTDRLVNITRVAHLCELLNYNGVFVIASFICPTDTCRRIVTEIVSDVSIVHVDCPLKVCEERDVKGMYAKARKGEIKGFTGVDADYIAPDNPDGHIRTDKETVDDCVKSLNQQLDIYNVFYEI